MRHMQIVKARDLDEARSSYLELLARRGVTLAPASEVYVETVHKARETRDTWLCYVGMPRQQAA